MSAKEQYDKVHHWAKAIVCTSVIILILLGRHLDIICIDVAAVVIWFFGVNPVAYVIESVLKLKHRHSRF